MTTTEEQLTPVQSEVAKDTTRFRVLNWGRRTGKTTLAVWEMIGAAVSEDNQNIAYFATTYQQARDIAWRELLKKLGTAAKKVNESRLEVTVHTIQGGESTISLRGWENIETARGQKFHFVVVDEVAAMRTFWDGWYEVLRPAMTDTKGRGMFISTPKGFNHFYELYTLDDPNFKSFHATTYDNPHVDPDELEEARKELTDDTFAQEYLGDFRKMEGLIYKEFDRRKHVYTDRTKQPDNPVEIMLAVDFGFRAPSAILTILKDAEGNYYVTSEYYEEGKTNHDLIEYCKSIHHNSVYADPAEPDRIKEMVMAGLVVQDVNKSVTAGIDVVRQLLKGNRLFVHASCKTLIFEFENYQYRPKTAAGESEKPLKENDHALDALRYSLFANHGVFTPRKPEWKARAQRQRQVLNETY